MLRGFYTAIGGMIAEQRRHDAITNNVANINTPGFKARSVPLRSFPEVLIDRMGGGTGPAKPIGRLNTGVLPEESVADFQEGQLRQTGLNSDFALSTDIQVPGLSFDANGRAVPGGTNGAGGAAAGANGTGGGAATASGQVYQPEGFFAVLDPNGRERYTRAGNFTVDSQGYLRTPDGSQVLGLGRTPIALDRPMSQIKVAADGRFYDARSGQPVTDAVGNPVGFFIARINDPNQLISDGGNLYELPQGTKPPQAVAAGQASVRQGYLEGSNVDAAASMVDLTAALRAYEANQKIVQYYDRSMDKAVNDVGKV